MYSTEADFILDEKSKPSNDGPIKDDSLYCLKSTFVFFQVERHMFCVPTYRFVDESRVFTTVFELPKPNGQVVKGSSREDPIVLPDISHHDFQNFLKALYPLIVSTQLTLSNAEWISVLRLSTLWYFLKYRKMAISSLNLRLNCVDKIVYGKEFKIRTWIEEGCAGLVDRNETISRDEAATVGFETTFSLFRIREKRLRDGSGSSGNTMTIREVLKDELKDELDVVEHSELKYRTEDEGWNGGDLLGSPNPRKNKKKGPTQKPILITFDD